MPRQAWCSQQLGLADDMIVRCSNQRFAKHLSGPSRCLGPTAVCIIAGVPNVGVQRGVDEVLLLKGRVQRGARVLA